MYGNITLQLKKLKFFVISERELLIIASCCERLINNQTTRPRFSLVENEGE